MTPDPRLDWEGLVCVVGEAGCHTGGSISSSMCGVLPNLPPTACHRDSHSVPRQSRWKEHRSKHLLVTMFPGTRNSSWFPCMCGSGQGLGSSSSCFDCFPRCIYRSWIRSRKTRLQLPQVPHDSPLLCGFTTMIDIFSKYMVLGKVSKKPYFAFLRLQYKT